jgi:hypothetical protein
MSCPGTAVRGFETKTEVKMGGEVRNPNDEKIKVGEGTNERLAREGAEFEGKSNQRSFCGQLTWALVCKLVGNSSSFALQFRLAAYDRRRTASTLCPRMTSAFPRGPPIHWLGIILINSSPGKGRILAMSLSGGVNVTFTQR